MLQNYSDKTVSFLGRDQPQKIDEDDLLRLLDDGIVVKYRGRVIVSSKWMERVAEEFKDRFATGVRVTHDRKTGRRTEHLILPRGRPGLKGGANEDRKGEQS